MKEKEHEVYFLSKIKNDNSCPYLKRHSSGERTKV
jgi:hypothetical protein